MASAPVLAEFSTTVTQDELAGLARIRQRRTQMWILFAAAAPALYGAYLLPDATAIPLMLVVLAAVFAGAFAHMRCRCPRCGKLFNMKGSRGHVTVSACAHCGLPLRAR